MNDVFNKLYSINVNDYIEKKNGLNYLSWANAWAEVKKIYPEANYTIYENTLPNGYVVNYFTDGKSAWVKTGVTIEGLEHIEELPVMDFRNKSIFIDNITSFDVNKAIQRSLTKALARHGLGLYIYAGEDLPEEEKEEIKPISDVGLKTLKELIKTLPETVDKKGFYNNILSTYGIKDLSQLTSKQYGETLLEIKKLRGE